MFGLNEKKFFAEKEYEMADEPILATLFTTGNGYMGVRGSFEEFGSLRIQGAFVRGYIDEIIEVCEPFTDNEYMKKYYLDEEKLKTFEKQDSCVNMPDFLLVRITIGDKTFFTWEGKILKWERYLDSANAEYIRKVTWDDGDGNVTDIEFRRFASFANQNVYCQKVTVKPVNHKLPVTITTGIDTAVKTCGQFITANDSFEADEKGIFYSFHAVNKYKFKAAYAVKNVFPKGSSDYTYSENGRLGIVHTCDKAKEYVYEKITFIGTERDTETDVNEWVKGNAEKLTASYETQKDLHLKAYHDYFDTMDIVIEGDDDMDGYLRFASYHTAISACMNDSVHGISAKGLTGERYNQFVWWDSEIHQMPFFIYTAPETAKHLLMYRYKMLPQAKKNAKMNGMDGAMFAFCSSVEGDERVWVYARHPFLQIHLNSDIPYGIIHYYTATGDEEFMKNYGMEMIHECLKFWRCRVVEKNGRYEILRVTGTDEHHPYVDNDAYTNYCVHFIFGKFLELTEKLGYKISKAEAAAFKHIYDNIYVPMLPNGMIPQFDGYFDLSRTLEEVGKGTLKQFQMKKSGLYHKSQVIKQPDVALLFTMVNVGVDYSHFAENWDYYEQMCESSSSLTFPVHAIASAKNHRMLSFYNYFKDTLKMDIDDIHGVAWQGVHSGCLAGGYLAMIYGIFGVVSGEDALALKPNAVPFFKKISAKLFYHGSKIALILEGNRLTAELLSGDPVDLILPDGKKFTLKNNVTVLF